MLHRTDHTTLMHQTLPWCCISNLFQYTLVCALAQHTKEHSCAHPIPAKAAVLFEKLQRKTASPCRAGTHAAFLPLCKSNGYSVGPPSPLPVKAAYRSVPSTDTAPVEDVNTSPTPAHTRAHAHTHTRANTQAMMMTHPLCHYIRVRMTKLCTHQHAACAMLLQLTVSPGTYQNLGHHKQRVLHLTAQESAARSAAVTGYTA